MLELRCHTSLRSAWHRRAPARWALLKIKKIGILGIFSVLLMTCTLRQKEVMTIHQQFEDWIERLNEIEIVDSEIIAFNFGAFETTEG